MTLAQVSPSHRPSQEDLPYGKVFMALWDIRSDFDH